ncbi:DUF5615 family PIN-like protein [Adhaeribacter pallidiroseus]|uniref:DUF5615 domain-containing protein n=1 Tax=Adhaeribacter pallidiroseus TaxID=2072847 RepID=A0A369QFF8_9BACT|nr:DUF5615 family PIN-like protein [Adhaeribacter pallidiroseus]RDC62295.1 hypothetical protein AHMF7616_00888 [Adhaeribacter pallidiroseus]
MGNTKILIDENLPRRLVSQLAACFIESAHVSEKSLLKNSDRKIWQYAKENNFTILTKDNDFTELSKLFGCPPKVIRLKCGNQTTVNLAKIMIAKLEIIINFLEAEELCYLEIE